MIGFHYSIGGNKNGLGKLIEDLNKAGIPILLKGADDAGPIYEAAKIGRRYGVKNHLIYRVTTEGQGGRLQYNVPDYSLSPRSAALRHYERTATKWPAELLKSEVWMEPINEPRAKNANGEKMWGGLHPVDWLGQFMLEYALIANNQGYKVVGPSFNSGEPEIYSENDYEQPGMLQFLTYSSLNPTLASLGVHEYAWDLYQTETFSDWYPSLFGRVEAAMAAADAHGIPRTFPIFVTEWGFAYTKAPRWEEAKPHLEAYAMWADRWPNVMGVAAWTLQSGYGGVDDDVASWIPKLAEWEKNRDKGQYNMPAIPHPQIYKKTDVKPVVDQPPTKKPAMNIFKLDMIPPRGVGVFDHFARGNKAYDANAVLHDEDPELWEVWNNIEIPTGFAIDYTTGGGFVEPQFKHVNPSLVPSYQSRPPYMNGLGTWDIAGAPGGFAQILGSNQGQFALQMWPDEKISLEPGTYIAWVSFYANYEEDGQPSNNALSDLFTATLSAGGAMGEHEVGPSEHVIIGIKFDVDENEAVLPEWEFRSNYPQRAGTKQSIWFHALGIMKDGSQLAPSDNIDLFDFVAVVNLFDQQAPYELVESVNALDYPQKRDSTYSHHVAAILTAGAQPGSVINIYGGRPESDLAYFDLVGAKYRFMEWPTKPSRSGFSIKHWPCNKNLRVTQVWAEQPNVYSKWGFPGHEGIDFGVPLGGSFYAVDYGRVVWASDKRISSPNRDSAYGGYVVIEHADGFYTLYAHAQKNFLVSTDDIVKPGDVIALSGNTGNSTGPHLHFSILQLDAQNPGWPSLYFPKTGKRARYINPAFFLSEFDSSIDVTTPRVGQPAPPSSAASDNKRKFHMPDYLFGDGRIFEVRHSDGSQSRFQSQYQENIHFQTKGEPIAEWEEMWAGGGYVWRGIDTSPGAGLYYEMFSSEGGESGAPWVPLDWSVGDSYTRDAFVVYKYKESGEINHGGPVTDTMTFVAHHDSITGYNGVVVADVIELKWSGGESYFYARGWGLVGWGRTHNDPNTPQASRISEVHAPGARPDNVREWISL